MAAGGWPTCSLSILPERDMETAKAFQPFDYLVIVGYFAILLGTALYFSRRTKLSKDFFMAGGNMPWWLAGISFFMASHSALSFVMYGELGYKYGIAGVAIYQMSVIGLVLGALYVARRWRRSRTATPVQFLEKRYSMGIRQVLAWTGIPIRIVDDALKIFSTAIFLFIGMKLSILSLPLAIGLAGAIMIFYAVLGGQLGVMVTDFLQFIIKIVIVLFVFVLTIVRFYGGGFSLDSFPAGFLDPLSGTYRGLNYLSVIVLMIISMNCSWALVQKYNCVRTEKDAEKVAWLVAGLNFIAPIIFFAPSILARVLLPDVQETKYAYAEIAFAVLPTGMMGMLVAGMFASTLSTMGSEFNVLAGVLTNDLYKRLFRPEATERDLVRVGRAATVLIGSLIIAVAILLSVLQGLNLFDIMFKVFGALFPATALPILAGFFWKRITARGAFTGLLAGAISGIALTLLNVAALRAYAVDMQTNPELQYWLKQGWDACVLFFNIAVTLAAMFLGSRPKSVTEQERARVQEYFDELARPVTAPSSGTSTFAAGADLRAMGGITSLFGGLMCVTGLLILWFSGEVLSLTINLFTGGGFLLIGFLVWLKGRKIPPQQASTLGQ
jgi:solute:Na+ symporter, SSS family